MEEDNDFWNSQGYLSEDEYMADSSNNSNGYGRSYRNSNLNSSESAILLVFGLIIVFLILLAFTVL